MRLIGKLLRKLKYINYNWVILKFFFLFFDVYNKLFVKLIFRIIFKKKIGMKIN